MSDQAIAWDEIKEKLPDTLLHLAHGCWFTQKAAVSWSSIDLWGAVKNVFFY